MARCAGRRAIPVGSAGYRQPADRGDGYLYGGLHYGFGTLRYSALRATDKLSGRPVLLAHSTGDSQVSYRNYELLLRAAQSNDVDLTTFTREGDQHMILLEQYTDDPAQDTEFFDTLLDFLDQTFPQAEPEEDAA